MSPDVSEDIPDLSQAMDALMHGKPAPETERRTRKRFPFEVPCIVYFLLDRTKVVSIQGRTCQISAGGICIVTRRFFRRDEPIEVEFSFAGQPPRHTAGLVRHCLYSANGLYHAGIQLYCARSDQIFTPDFVKQSRHELWLAESLRNSRAR
jgi:hypothetical protein